LIVDVTNCARCHGEHRETTFYPLANPQDRFDWWATCPRVRQPILLARVPDVEG
jgi:hypothetical protein